MAADIELNDIAKFLETRVKAEFLDQGHNNTGKGLNSIKVEFKTSADMYSFIGFGEGYLNIVDSGVRPENIPYSRGSGARSSRFIQALVTWIKQRAIATGDREALGIAFAIASKMKKEGMPTRGSLRFSKTGERLGFIGIALEDSEAELARRLEDRIDDGIQLNINRIQ